jgi:dolichol-phosphate mannosyltransferase
MKKISVTIPIYNELPNIPLVHKAIRDVFANLKYDYEIIFIDDGSTDGSVDAVNTLMIMDTHVSLIEFSRNFGKEAATTAGFHHAIGDAVVCIDADLQHPPSLIHDFIKAWENGHEVVIGVRTNNASDSKLKKLGSHLYYKIINKISHTPIIPRATDFRLVDRHVVDEFNRLSEHNRMTRGLVDWLGFRRHLIYFEAPERMHGEASYGFWKLAKLAVESMIANSLMPLRIAGYVGTVIMIASFALGLLMMFDRFFFDWGFKFSGPAILADIILFLVGIVLVSLGLIAYYIGHIYHDVQDRPLYIVRKKRN